MEKTSLKLLSGIFFLFAPRALALTIVTSNGVLASIAHDLLGDYATIISLTASETDPHTFELKPTDYITLEKADLIFINGEGLETWETKTFRIRNWQKKIVVASQGLPLLTLKTETGSSNMHDPHFWHDPRLTVKAAANMAKKVFELQPDIKKILDQHQKKLEKDYLADYRFCQNELKHITTRVAVTSHDAFQYFEKAYDIKFIAPQGWSTSSEVLPKQVATLKDWLLKQQVGAMFLENSVKSPLLQKLEHETHIKMGGNLYSDTLSAANGPAATYEKMIRWNCSTVAKALR